MSSSRLLARVNSEVDIASLPIDVANQSALELDSIWDVGEAEGDSTSLGMLGCVIVENASRLLRVTYLLTRIVVDRLNHSILLLC